MMGWNFWSNSSSLLSLAIWLQWCKGCWTRRSHSSWPKRPDSHCTIYNKTMGRETETRKKGSRTREQCSPPSVQAWALSFVFSLLCSLCIPWDPLKCASSVSSALGHPCCRWQGRLMSSTWRWPQGEGIKGPPPSCTGLNVLFLMNR